MKEKILALVKEMYDDFWYMHPDYLVVEIVEEIEEAKLSAKNIDLVGWYAEAKALKEENKATVIRRGLQYWNILPQVIDKLRFVPETSPSYFDCMNEMYPKGQLIDF